MILRRFSISSIHAGAGGREEMGRGRLWLQLAKMRSCPKTVPRAQEVCASIKNCESDPKMVCAVSAGRLIKGCTNVVRMVIAG